MYFIIVIIIIIMCEEVYLKLLEKVAKKPIYKDKS